MNDVRLTGARHCQHRAHRSINFLNSCTFLRQQLPPEMQYNQIAFWRVKNSNMACFNGKYMRRLLLVTFTLLSMCMFFLVVFPSLGKDHLQYVQTKTISDLKYWGGHLLGDRSLRSHVVSLEDDQTFMMDMGAEIIDKKNEAEATQRRRRKGVSDGCIEHKKSLSQLTDREKYNLFRHIIVNDRYKFLYCVVPKVACSNWKRTIMALDERVDDPSSVSKVTHRNFTFLYNLPSDRILYSLKNYYKFMFVRPPLERLVSAYRDKFITKAGFTAPLFARSFGRKIVHKFRRGASRNNSGDDVTFTEFVKFLLSSKRVEMNEHWMSYNNLCHPCTITYDFIGTMETFDQDVYSVLKDVGVQNVSFPERQKYYNPTTTKLVSDYMNELSPDLRKRLIRLYQKDFTMFQYKPY